MYLNRKKDFPYVCGQLGRGQKNNIETLRDGKAFIRLNIERPLTDNGKTVGPDLVRLHYLPRVCTLGTRDPRDSAWMLTEKRIASER